MKMHLIGLLIPLLASLQTVHAIPLETASSTAITPIRTTAPIATPTGLLQRRAPAETDSSSTTSTRTQFSLSLSLDLPTNTCRPTIAPDKNGYVPPTECNAIYDYYPSSSAAVAVTVLFGMLLLAHTVQMFTYKTGFVWVIIMGIAWEFGGYLVRIFSTKNQQSLGLVIITQLLVLLAPLWVNAFDYMVLARMIYFFVPEKRIWFFKPSLLAIIFVCLDFGSFMVQATGGSIASPGGTASTIQTGLNIYMGGIGIQQFFICCFLVLTVLFHRRMLQLERQGALQGDKTRWKGLLFSLYFSLIAISVRIIYRLVEYTSGVGLNNPITTHEWFMYVFDAFPMLLAGGVWCIMHPGRILTGPDAKLPSSGLGRILCCGYCCCRCCGGGRKKKTVTVDSERPSQEELTSVERDPYTSTSPMWRNGRNDRTDGNEPYRSQMV
ncbi:hypothetical protein EYB26_002435 [Talaromyces marneffei]|uniref:uncharacterized protein n=1 Tax=Talaromyces marneffei TaxID=37727 RepID=UPI0012A9CB51|nr:uncharacterized protein EYB26_002435 [Talaromyces marneffei]QGA14779.1 hypothetical protein EYB26_002435 [Talaromyces marneffei]